MTAARRARLRLRVQRALSRRDAAHAPIARRIRQWAHAAVQMRPIDVTVRLVGEPEARRLNRDYRGKDYATNILSFVYEPDARLHALAAGELLQGDLVLCVPVVLHEAEAQCKTLDAHFAHLVVHGMLHLQGFDHEEDYAAQQMEALERAVLATLGYADPYADEAA